MGDELKDPTSKFEILASGQWWPMASAGLRTHDTFPIPGLARNHLKWSKLSTGGLLDLFEGPVCTYDSWCDHIYRNNA
jgi:hypothetical protein